MTVEEGRLEERYSFLRVIEGVFGSVDFALADIGEHGLHVQHLSAIKLGTEDTVSFAVTDAGVSVRLHGYVVWSRFADPKDTRPYHSGIRVDDPDGVLKSAIKTLLEYRTLRVDEESMARKRAMLEKRSQATKATRLKQTTQAPRIPDDVILLVKQTSLRLQANPAESVRWYNRAKYSLNEAGEQIHARDDVLAVWEYLERSVELSIITRILN